MTKKQPRKTVLITGGTGSVGEALVRAFAGNDYHVVFQFNHNQERAQALAALPRVTPAQVDFAGPFELPKEDFDIVINNAGVNITDASTHEVEFPHWEETLRINVTIPFLICKAYLPGMVARNWGRIINISSVYGLRGVEGNLPYTVSKHALSGLTKTLAKEYASRGITCNEICPGPIESEMMQRIAMRIAETEGGNSATYLREVREGIPAGRMATPSDVAELALFLSTDAASYLNGVSVPLDGGLLA